MRWREWMRRIEAVLFASASPVSRHALANVVGSQASVDLLIEDLRAELAERPYDLIRAGAGWMLQTRPVYAAVIRAAADTGGQDVDLSELDLAVLAGIAYHQPVTRLRLSEIFGIDVSRDRLARLRRTGLIVNGPRSPTSGGPATYVTTDSFLAMFGLESLRDLPDPSDDAPTEQED